MAARARTLHRPEMLARTAALAVFLLTSSGCGGLLSQNAPYRPPPKPDDASTFVVVARGGMAEQFVVVDGRVTGVVHRNTWTDVTVPPGDHDVLVAVNDDPPLYAKVFGSYPCLHVKATTRGAHAYYFRVGYIHGGKQDDSMIAAIDARESQLKTKDSMTGTYDTAGHLSNAIDGMGASGGRLASSLVSDPEPSPGQPAGYFYRIALKPLDVGRSGTKVLEDVDRQVLKSPSDAQKRFDEIKSKIPGRCFERSVPLGPDDFVE